MGDPKGFLKTARETPRRRPVDVRLTDWREVYEPFARERAERQAARCMDCGIPFCHNGCPLGNLIPEWNDLVYRSDWEAAADRLHATNNFPEFTGRLCPAPCEAACVLGINAEPVTIKQVEVEIADRALTSGWVRPEPPAVLTGRTVAIVGSGPAGLAAAQQLTRAGHTVTVYERAEAPGGLLRFGIPEFKLEKRHLDRRLDQMRAEGTMFACGINVGRDVTAAQLRAEHDAVVLAGGATIPRGLPVPGADLDGICQAMEFLPPANRAVTAGTDPAISARGRHVVIIGGGDTGADCLGTVHRQGAASVTQLEIMPQPPGELREVVGRVQSLDRVAPVVAVDEVVPVRDEVPERAAVVAERDATVHAPPGLRDERLPREGLVHLAPVAQPDGHRSAGGRLTAPLEETGGLTHAPPPSRAPASRPPKGRAPGRRS